VNGRDAGSLFGRRRPGGTKGIFIAGKHFKRFDTGGSFSPDALVSKLMDFIFRLDLPLRKVGIAVPGLVDSSGRVVACDVLPAFEGWDPNKELARLGYQATALNDVRAALLQELHDAPPGITAGIVMAGTAAPHSLPKGDRS
jgi:predicted NBD/HSP70 family sugar kinase